MKTAAAGLVVLAFAAIASAAYASAPAANTLLQPPLQHGQPVKVAIGLRIINIASIDEVKEQFELDGYLIARWSDPRLATRRTVPTTAAANTNGARSGFPTLK